MTQSTQPLAPPECSAVLDLVDKFYPGVPAVREESTAPAFADLGPSYACTFLDDSGQVVGAVVADLRMALALGGRLLMLPDGPLIEQAKEGSASDSIVEAMSEVFNHMTIASNKVDGNAHVKSTYAEPTEQLTARPEGAWIEAASGKGLHLITDVLEGVGRLWFVSKS